MEKIHIVFLTVIAIFLGAIATLSTNSLGLEKRDDLFGCKAQAIDKFTEEQTRTGKKYSEYFRRTMLSIDADACVERNTYEYSDRFPRYLPSIFQ
jgi:hypothetical protein